MASGHTPHTPCIIQRPMNDHGALTLSEITGRRTFQVVECASREVRETLALAAAGSTVRVWLEPLSSRGDAWQAVDIEGGVETTPGDTELFRSPIPL